MEHMIGDRFKDRWATLYLFEHEGSIFSCACQVLMDTIMMDDEKMHDIRTRKDRFAFDKNRIVELMSRARKKGRINEVLYKSMKDNGFEGDMRMMDAEVIGMNGTSVLMKLSAVTHHGLDAWQYFNEEDFQKRFIK